MKTEPCKRCEGAGIEYVKGINDETEIAICRRCQGKGENVDNFTVRVSQRAIDDTNEYFKKMREV